MKTLRFLLGDQLSQLLSALADINRANDVILMAEVHDETTCVRHHKQKLVLVLSAMRHFARELRDQGFEVDYIQLEDRDNTGSFTGELHRVLALHDRKRSAAPVESPHGHALPQPGPYARRSALGDHAACRGVAGAYRKLTGLNRHSQ